ncbi:MAG: hypothetical protein JRH13_06060 [Deltaproteobacteria bacterium]|nr:hypothetical protein [Deltaproteobacteria bacterium]MBW2128910.1 hypothetical protein [Deltaproteobacteria bacterium]MBW2303871.1 hypothetical protein [Deltaproteobacteria bacterium]
MSAIKEAISAMREVLLLTGKVDRVGSLLSQISDELRDHDRRLVRLETLVEAAQKRQSHD